MFFLVTLGNHIGDRAAVFFDIKAFDVARLAMQIINHRGLHLLIEHEKFLAGHFLGLDMFSGKGGGSSK